MKLVIDGKIKFDQFENFMFIEFEVKFVEVDYFVYIFQMVVDFMFVIGIVVVVFGIINMMFVIVEGFEVVGEKVVVVFIGMLFGIFIFYGFIVLFVNFIYFMNQIDMQYLCCIFFVVVGFVKGFVLFIVVEVVCCLFDGIVQFGFDEFEIMFKFMFVLGK